MQQTVTGKGIAAFWGRCTSGRRLTCLANTYNASAPGTTGIITKPGKTSMRLTQADGRNFWINPPQRVRDVVQLTEDTITYYIGGDSEHTATWKVEVCPICEDADCDGQHEVYYHCPACGEPQYGDDGYLKDGQVVCQGCA